MSVTAFAAPSVTVLCQSSGGALSGVSFALYRVADADGTVVPAFSPFRLGVERITEQNAETVTDTLAAYLYPAGLSPTAHITTNETGYAAVRDGLKDGVYLLIGTPVTRGDTVSVPQTTPVFLPSHADGKTVSDPLIRVKFSEQSVSAPTEVHAVKIWDDKSDAFRPKSITAVLRENGKEIDQKPLSAENGWQYEWKELSPERSYTVTERDTPDGYTVQLQTEGDIVRLINTNPTEPAAPTPPEKRQTEVPYTGVPRLHIWVTAALGIILIAIGWGLKRKDEK